MSSLPILSIVIPAYNAAEYCAACFDSILRGGSDPARYEVVVVDDGSRDATPEIIRSYCDAHANFSAIRQENSGVSVAREKGTAAAAGAYIWFIDSDDYVVENAVDNVLACIDAHPEVDAFFAPTLMRDENTGREWVKPYAAAPEGSLPGKEYLKRQPVSICPAQFIFRKALAANPWIHFPKGLRHEDEYFFRTLQYFAQTLLILDRPLYVYRQWGGSFMNSASDKSMNDMVEVYRQLKAFVEEGAAAEDREWLRADIFSFLMGTHFWHIDTLKTDTFRAFRKKNIAYIKQEFAANRHLLSRKDRLLGSLMLHCPGLFADLMKCKRQAA